MSRWVLRIFPTIIMIILLLLFFLTKEQVH